MLQNPGMPMAQAPYPQNPGMPMGQTPYPPQNPGMPMPQQNAFYPPGPQGFPQQGQPYPAPSNFPAQPNYSSPPQMAPNNFQQNVQYPMQIPQQQPYFSSPPMQQQQQHQPQLNISPHQQAEISSIKKVREKNFYFKIKNCILKHYLTGKANNNGKSSIRRSK